MLTKFLYTLITPEGIEVLVGAYTNDATAARAIQRKHAADWLQLACYPLQQRAVSPGEKIQAPRRWTADDEAVCVAQANAKEFVS